MFSLSSTVSIVSTPSPQMFLLLLVDPTSDQFEDLTVVGEFSLCKVDYMSSLCHIKVEDDEMVEVVNKEKI
ncbi:hypothetical protein L2E82_33864 [Cichorium intybus]|uniref:Uncharacterized protein n=1 Tax=Cichorium intybus TaxID=13427 RepID=A0ACB9BL73_CICIN|nr:hypothetical protein L2E82_33864 [Cichorium intybus]